MSTSQIVYQIMQVVESKLPTFELEGSGPDMVYYQVQGQEESVAFFVEDINTIWSPIFGEFKSVAELEAAL